MKKGPSKIIVSFALLILFLLFMVNNNNMVVKADDEISYEILLINSAANSEDNTIIENFNGSEEDIGILVNALESGIHPYNIYAPEYELPFPLLALDMEDENLLRIFAKYGADYNYSNFRINGEFHSPLSFYVSDWGNSENIIKLLIELGMDPYREGTGRRAILYAAKNHNTTALYYLLDLGIDPDPVVPSRSPIKEAIKKEDFLTISMLLDANADIFYRDSEGVATWQLIKEKAEKSSSSNAEKVLKKIDKILEDIWSETAIHISDAQRLLDYPEYLIESRLSNLNLKYGILDVGFNGLNEWLETHTEERELTHFAYDTAGDESDHGYWVYRVVRAIAPDAEIYIGRAFNAQHLSWLYQNQVGLASMSVAGLRWIAPDLSNTGSEHKTFLRILNEAGIYLFVSAGNAYHKIDSDFRTDINKNGWLELLRNDKPPGAQEYYTFYVHEGIPFQMRVGSNYWDVKHDLDLELLVREDGENIIFTDAEVVKTTPHNYIIKGVTDRLRSVALRVRANNIDEAHKDKLKVRIFNNYGISRFHYNGQDSITFPADYISPYIIAVGSIGRDPERGQAISSSFSSIGSNSAGQLPHVLGPGELIIDNQIIQGSSYATPLIGAFASFRPSISPKTLMEYISTDQKWSTGIDESLKGAWGIPSFELMGDNSLPIFADEMQISKTGYKHLDNGDTRLSFNVNKDYLQGMRVFFKMDVIDPETRQVVMIKNTSTPLSIKIDGLVREEGLKDARINLDIPKEAIPERFIGEEVFIRVYTTTGLQRDKWTEIPELYLRLALNE